MFEKWKLFDINEIDPEYDYKCIFQDGYIEKWYGSDLLEASKNQGAIFVFQIVEVKRLGKPSERTIEKRRKALQA